VSGALGSTQSVDFDNVLAAVRRIADHALPRTP